LLGVGVAPLSLLVSFLEVKQKSSSQPSICGSEKDGEKGKHYFFGGKAKTKEIKIRKVGIGKYGIFCKVLLSKLLLVL